MRLSLTLSIVLSLCLLGYALIRGLLSDSQGAPQQATSQGKVVHAEPERRPPALSYLSNPWTPVVLLAFGQTCLLVRLNSKLVQRIKRDTDWSKSPPK
jgi:hypothetical protein